MKKIIVLFALFLFSVMPAFCDTIQQVWEENLFLQPELEKLLDTAHTDEYIRNDYKNYLEGKNSFYTALSSLLESDAYWKLPKNDLNKKYLDMLLNNYFERLKAVTTSTYLAGVISVSDSEYKLLNQSTKKLIAMYNYLFAQDI